MWYRAVKDKEAPSRAGIDFRYADARGPELPEGVLNEIWIPGLHFRNTGHLLKHHVYADGSVGIPPGRIEFMDSIGLILTQRTQALEAPHVTLAVRDVGKASGPSDSVIIRIVRMVLTLTG